MKKENKATRKGSPPIKVYCLPEERHQIQANAQATGLSLSTFLLNVGIGYQVRGIVDNKQVEELARINGDLGRLGGLLKLWLTDDARLASVGEATIRAVLSRIESTQDQMIHVMGTVVRPRAD
ncbi:conjugal transfer transcriptional regulator TraJ [Candidatus Accumulibacter phosphatis]|uniref:Conjugal transfer transcriptional regulator TraJ n=1 Tax=Candidatus Accumulibacter phosphatis TaxID=327160 RepID=A0ABX1U160_9PROT|nr:conjugal transfer transcriptional regulator TraJ [Candidatus Accumulibacter phosphatis]NMQ30266.1 conjugal transfer transcriptional regulator TraJ [Candidatus Accumulibacter phosphatis]